MRHRDMRPMPYPYYVRGRMFSEAVRKFTRKLDLSVPPKPSRAHPTASSRMTYMAHYRLAQIEAQRGLRVL